MRKSWLLRSLLFCTVIFFMVACCQENSDCPPDSFCIKAPEDCEGEGVCIEKSSVPCDVVKGPVCGCDGKIYDNICEAAEAGVSVTNEGKCKEVCEDNDNCKEGYYCAKAVGDCEGEGVCTVKETATACLDVIVPVCGCDGETYDNICEAAEAGVNVDYEGKCKEVCEDNDNCKEGYYCAKAVGDCEGEGVCTEIPAADACVTIYEPVCGCDGKTYGNDCEAGAVGVSVAYEGECKINEPPDCNEAYANPDELWSPNHKYVNIGIMGVTDPDGDPLTITINSIIQDEEVNAKGKGAGNTSPDGMGVGTSTASIRAERQGKGNGRVYKISFAATDPAGAECSGAVQVCVPHDQKPGHDCIDDGYNYDSTVE